jgi:GT2 family glycosyltransferase
MGAASADPKAVVTTLAQAALRAFLGSGCTLDLRPTAPPRVSALMVLCNRAELTLTCLQTLAARLSAVPFEVIAVDNGSTDETTLLLERARGVKLVRNERNAGYTRAVNQGARLATAEYLLLLNNDTQPLGRSLDVAADFLDANPRVGCVGGKLILLDGTLQEAGCCVWRNGWTLQYGRGQSPRDPEYAFEREVDYCSGAFMMTRRGLFLDSGAFDEAFNPGYFEDPDYGARLWKAGWRFVYLPGIEVLHYENATSGGLFDLTALLARNRAIFLEKHGDWVASRPCPTELPPLFARLSHDISFKVLLLSSGPAPLERAVARLQALDAFVTLGLTGPADRPPADLEGLPRNVERVGVPGVAGLASFLEARRGYYDLAVLDETATGLLPAVRSARLPWAVWQYGRFVPQGLLTRPKGQTYRRAG